MKKGILYILVLIVVCMSAFATIKITSPFAAEYNRGDLITLDGYIIGEDDINESEFTVDLRCDSDTDELYDAEFDINDNQKVTFETLGVTSYTLPKDAKGDCTIIVEYTDEDGDTGETEESQSFQATTNLEGVFSLNKDKLLAGDTIILSGEVFTINGKGVEGTAKIYLKKNKEKRDLLNETDIVNGEVYVELNLATYDAGKYRFEIEVEDEYNNEEEFDDIDEFSVLEGVNVYFFLDGNEYAPGDIIMVEGELDTHELADVSDFNIELELNELPYSVSTVGESFEYELEIPVEISEGQHRLYAFASDGKGNTGKYSKLITIKRSLDKLVMETNGDLFSPKEEIVVSFEAHDQAEEAVSDEITADVTLSGPEELIATTLSTTDTLTYEIPEFTKEGTYDLTITYDSFKVTKQIRIEADVLLYSLDEKRIIINNTNDREITENIVIKAEADGKETVLEKEITLSAQSSTIVDLQKELGEGEYDVTVLENDVAKLQKPITITEGFRFPLQTVLLLMILVVVLYVGYKNMHIIKKKNPHRVQKEMILTKKSKDHNPEVKEDKEKFEEYNDEFD